MADKVIQIEGVGNVSFPDFMSDDQIAAVIKQQNPNLGRKQYDTSIMDAITQKGYDPSQDKRSFGRKLLDDVVGNENLPLTQQGPIQRATGFMMGNASQGVADIGQGNYAKGTNQLINAATPIAAVTGGPSLVRAGLGTAARTLGGAYIGSKAAGIGADLSEATPDQKELAQNLGGLGGGAIAGSGLIRAIFETPAKDLLANHGETLLKMMSPKETLRDFIDRAKNKPESFNAPNESAAANKTFTSQKTGVPSYISEPLDPKRMLTNYKNALYDAQTNGGDAESIAYFKKQIADLEGNQVAKASNLNSPDDISSFNEQAAQNLFKKPFAQLSGQEKLQTIPETIKLQNEARVIKGRQTQSGNIQRSQLKKNQADLVKAGMKLDPVSGRFILE